MITARKAGSASTAAAEKKPTDRPPVPSAASGSLDPNVVTGIPLEVVAVGLHVDGAGRIALFVQYLEEGIAPVTELAGSLVVREVVAAPRQLVIQLDSPSES